MSLGMSKSMICEPKKLGGSLIGAQASWRGSSGDSAAKTKGGVSRLGKDRACVPLFEGSGMGSNG